MTRTPRPNHQPQPLSDRILGRIPAVFRRIPAVFRHKTAAFAAIGLALAGLAGATAAAGFTGPTASADGVMHGVSRSVDAVPGGHARAVAVAPARHQDPAGHGAAASHQAPGKHATQAKDTTQVPGKHTTRAKHPGPNRRAAATNRTAGQHAAHARHRAGHHARTWSSVRRIVAKRTYPKASHGPLPALDQLTPVRTSGPQTWMPITPARFQNARTIVRQAIARHMGLRAAVIAVATSMQESTLLNLNYGDRDSLGLFQQRPSSGWGSPSQIGHPAYAANAFLSALHDYQGSNPGWAHQPLWEAAQGVQGSAFPSAYAKWEAQAAHLVASVTKHLV